MKHIFCITFFLMSFSFLNAQDCGKLGINITGNESSWERFPTSADLDFLKSKGISLIRFPIAWEKLEPSLVLGALDSCEVKGLIGLLDSAYKRGMKVIVDIHNYARYNPVWADTTGWHFKTNGKLTTSTSIYFPISQGQDYYQFIVRAEAGPAVGSNTINWPKVQLQLDGSPVGQPRWMSKTSFDTIDFHMIKVAQGYHTISIAYTNQTGITRALNVSGMTIWGRDSLLIDTLYTNLSAGNMMVDTLKCGNPLSYNYANTTAGSAYFLESGRIGSDTASVWKFVNFWKQLAKTLRGKQGLAGYDLMNEPYGSNTPPNSLTWQSIAQTVVDTLRSVDATTTIYVEGTWWSSASDWGVENQNFTINDSIGNNNIIYEAHQYFDDGSGSYGQPYDNYRPVLTSQTGAQKVKPFLDWLAAGTRVARKGFIGEFGIPNNDWRWGALMENFLDTIYNHDVSGTYFMYSMATPDDPVWWQYQKVMDINPAYSQNQMGLVTKQYVTKTNCGTSSSRLSSTKVKKDSLEMKVENESPLTDHLNNKKSSVIVYPNPMENGNFSVQIDMERGKYRMTVTNSQGQRILGKEIEHSGGIAVENIDLPKSLSSGIYELTLMGNGITISRKIIKD
jgi:aryl-phospho-beta-D-glucosidase BglC (GH1 family)